MKTGLNKVQSHIWLIVKEINKEWYKGNSLKMDVFFHPEVVFNSSDFKHQIVGKQKCTQTYIDFF